MMAQDNSGVPMAVKMPSFHNEASDVFTQCCDEWQERWLKSRGPCNPDLDLELQATGMTAACVV